MHYRVFGKTGFKVSGLGFGCMRLPTKDGKIDFPEATRMVRHAIDLGVNYLDTAYVYHDRQSEVFVGQVIRDGYREKVAIATKMPVWDVNTAEDFERLLDEQRAKLQVEKIDFYMLHALNQGSWVKMRDLGVIPWLHRMKASGKIGHFGFSFHDKIPAFKQIVDEFEGAAFAQIQYNLLNEDVQAGTEGLSYAAGKGLAVIVMEPLLGGTLCVPPPAVQALYDASGLGLTPAELSLRWLWDKPEVSLVLSGMTTFQQVQENLASARRAGIGRMSEAESKLAAAVQATYKGLTAIPCTACGYCVPCPVGVKIPEVFSMLNDIEVYGETRVASSKRRYAKLEAQQRADACISCRKCEEKCPQGIPISEWMPKVHAALA
jgi:predicted aldo/keto reductase-like oxidoreductase